MIRTARERLTDRKGRSKIITILLILVVIMAAVMAYPIYEHYRDEAGRVECEAAMSTARREMTTDYLMSLSAVSYTSSDALNSVVMYGRDNICPSGGTVYIIEKDRTSSSPYELVCGLHNEDKKQCTRLNSNYVFSQVQDAVKLAQSRGDAYPASVTVKLHSKELTALLVDEETGLHRGTDNTKDYEGTVVFYSIVGHSSFGADSGLEDGEIWYFSYADENHSATWTNKKSWTGDSYE